MPCFEVINKPLTVRKRPIYKGVKTGYKIPVGEVVDTVGESKVVWTKGSGRALTFWKVFLKDSWRRNDNALHKLDDTDVPMEGWLLEWSPGIQKKLLRPATAEKKEEQEEIDKRYERARKKLQAKMKAAYDKQTKLIMEEKQSEVDELITVDENYQMSNKKYQPSTQPLPGLQRSQSDGVIDEERRKRTNNITNPFRNPNGRQSGRRQQRPHKNWVNQNPRRTPSPRLLSPPLSDNESTGTCSSLSVVSLPIIGQFHTGSISRSKPSSKRGGRRSDVKRQRRNSSPTQLFRDYPLPPRFDPNPVPLVDFRSAPAGSQIVGVLYNSADEIPHYSESICGRRSPFRAAKRRRRRRYSSSLSVPVDAAEAYRPQSVNVVLKVPHSTGASEYNDVRKWGSEPITRPRIMRKGRTIPLTNVAVYNEEGINIQEGIDLIQLP